jgi:predicted N-acetyltransferase YhbS
MDQGDVPDVIAIQAECYRPEIIEDEAAIRARLNLSPDTAWIAEDTDGVVAYLVAYCSDVGKVTPLGGIFPILTEARSLYLHDLAVSDRAKSSGVGMALIQLACAKAQTEGLEYSSLVSVQGSIAYWKKHGYEVWTFLEPDQRLHLHSYGDQGCYMVRRLSP